MHYILVHGSWHGPWCWEKLVPFLKQNNHTVECVDLPGYEEKGALSKITYQDYYDHLKKVVLGCNEPPVLVSHSMSGIIAGPLSDEIGEGIQHTFFISAFLPAYGESLLDVALRYDQSAIPSILEVDPVRKVHILDPKGAKKALYDDCSLDVQDWAVKQLRPQPYTPLETPLEWKDSFKRNDQRTYIICELDRDIEPRAQRDMLLKHPSKVISMQCGHFPFLSQPEKLAEILLQKDLN